MFFSDVIVTWMSMSKAIYFTDAIAVSICYILSVDWFIISFVYLYILLSKL